MKSVILGQRAACTSARTRKTSVFAWVTGSGRGRRSLVAARLQRIFSQHLLPVPSWRPSLPSVILISGRRRVEMPRPLSSDTHQTRFGYRTLRPITTHATGELVTGRFTPAAGLALDQVVRFQFDERVDQGAGYLGHAACAGERVRASRCCFCARCCSNRRLTSRTRCLIAVT